MCDVNPDVSSADVASSFTKPRAKTVFVIKYHSIGRYVYFIFFGNHTIVGDCVSAVSAVLFNNMKTSIASIALLFAATDAFQVGGAGRRSTSLNIIAWLMER